MSYIRRYTDVLSLIDILKHNRLTLLSLDTWFDQNDSFGLREYGRQLRGSVYALCMTEAPETGHHWQLFAGSNHGVCIHFDADLLKAHLNDLRDPVLHGPVRYLNLKQVGDLSPIDLETLPFLKRETFKDEIEYRVVAWEIDLFASETYHVPLPAHLVKQVTFGPRMPRDLAVTMKSVVCEFVGCDQITFKHSRVHNNESWRKAILQASPRHDEPGSSGE